MNLTIKQKMLGGLTYQEFLSEYWQQKPLLVRQAFDGSPVDISAEELAGISCDTTAPSRIVIEHGDTPWTSLFGPFDDDTFANLPPSHWTLLVNDLERYFPELRQISSEFHFIPDWRLDDLMLSYATRQGSVGPHTDEYDVFLIQTAGKREWKIDSREKYDTDILEDCSLSILQNFNADNAWVLTAGDMLYLPPNMPHHGIAQDDHCMTLSVGFRAPSQRELIYNWVDSIADSPEFKLRFNDKKRKVQRNAAEISQHDIDLLSKLVTEGLDTKKSTLSHWLGKYLTETKGEVEIEYGQEKKPTQPSYYERKNWLRLAYIEDEKTIHFFADGEHFTLTKDAKEAVLYLCDHHIYTPSFIEKYSKLPAFKTTFKALLKNKGVV
jgi:50S ribosomal protein L16 3-hydroxylase